jgi:hypothetical protein
MATRFVSTDRDTPRLLPPNLRDWVPADHLVHFILDAVDALDLRQVKVNPRGTGSEQYPPRMLLPLLIYSTPPAPSASRRCAWWNKRRTGKPPARWCMRRWRRRAIIGAWPTWKRGPSRRRPRPARV